MTSSDESIVCSLQVSPLSDRSMTISLSFPRRAAKCGTSRMTGLKFKYRLQTIKLQILFKLIAFGDVLYSQEVNFGKLSNTEC